MLGPLQGKEDGADQRMGFGRDKGFRRGGACKSLRGWLESQTGGPPGLGIPTNFRRLVKTIP